MCTQALHQFAMHMMPTISEHRVMDPHGSTSNVLQRVLGGVCIVCSPAAHHVRRILSKPSEFEIL